MSDEQPLRRDLRQAEVPVEWATDTGSIAVHDTARLAPWALLAAIVALLSSFFVGWGIPVAIIAIIAAIICLRRPVESRGMSMWALILGIVATIYSTGWLIWAVMEFERLG